jgi:hypothetical protein
LTNDRRGIDRSETTATADLVSMSVAEESAGLVFGSPLGFFLPFAQVGILAHHFFTFAALFL